MARRVDKTCYLCGIQTQPTAGNPSVWPIWLGWPGGNGKSRCYCTGCVIDKVNAAAPLGNLSVRIKLSESMVAKLQAGETVHFRLPGLKNLVKIVKGEVEETIFNSPEWDNLRESFEDLFKSFGKLFSRSN